MIQYFRFLLDSSVRPQILLNLTVFLLNLFLFYWSAPSVSLHALFFARHHCPPTDWPASFQGRPLDIIASLAAIFFTSSSLAVPHALWSKAVKAITILRVCLFALKYSQSSAPYLPFVLKAFFSSWRLSLVLPSDGPQTLYLLFVILIFYPRDPCVPFVSLWRHPLLAFVCLTCVCWILYFSLPCLRTIQVTLLELHIDCFMILCNTTEPEMNYRDLSSEHLPSNPPHAFTYSPFLSPFLFHISLPPLILSLPFLPSFYIVFYFYSTVPFFPG